VGGERVTRTVRCFTTDDVDYSICRGSRVTHPLLGLTCPVGGKGNKPWCGWVMHVEQLSGIIVVEEDDAGERTRVTTEDEAEGGVEHGKCMPGEGSSL
jgi:hypothetical protein